MYTFIAIFTCMFMSHKKENMDLHMNTYTDTGGHREMDMNIQRNRY